MRKSWIIAVVLVVFPFLSYSMGETLTVKLKDGTERELVFANMQKITFNAGTMIILLKNNSTVSLPLSEMQKILFSPETATEVIEMEAIEANTHVSVYPNPVHDVLYVDGVEENTVINVFNVKGMLMQTVTAKEKIVQLNVNTLPQGVYILQAGKETVRFIKN